MQVAGTRAANNSRLCAVFDPWWARDRLSSILAYGAWVASNTASNNPKMAPLYFCRFGRKLMLVEDADLYKQARPSWMSRTLRRRKVGSFCLLFWLSPRYPMVALMT